jgi:hypothetical protein
MHDSFFVQKFKCIQSREGGVLDDVTSCGLSYLSDVFDHHHRSNPEYVGATTLSLYDAMVDALDKGKRGLFLQSSGPCAGLPLSAEEVQVRGVLLRKQRHLAPLAVGAA